MKNICVALTFMLAAWNAVAQQCSTFPASERDSSAAGLSLGVPGAGNHVLGTTIFASLLIRSASLPSPTIPDQYIPAGTHQLQINSPGSSYMKIYWY